MFAFLSYLTHEAGTRQSVTALSPPCLEIVTKDIQTPR